MISKLKGHLEEIEDDKAIIGTNGISYEIFVPASTLPKLKLENMRENSDEITFHTIYYIEGSGGVGNLTPRLIGFLSPVEREFFKLLIQVPDFGPRKALKTLTVPINKIAFAIETGDTKSLSDLPGVGKRTADKIVAELRGKVAKFALIKEGEAELFAVQERFLDFKNEALEVLLQLDYKKAEAEEMIKTALEKNQKIKDSEELIKEIFQMRKTSAVAMA